MVDITERDRKAAKKLIRKYTLYPSDEDKVAAMIADRIADGNIGQWIDDFVKLQKEAFLKSMRWWWGACKDSEQRAEALRMYVGPTIETANGIKEIWEIAQVASVDDLDDIVIKVLKEHADRIPYFLTF